MARPKTGAPKRQTGRVVDWNDERGFGFIEAQGSRRFFHISDVARRGGARPDIGMAVSFEPAVSRDRPAAVAVVLVAGGRMAAEREERGAAPGRPGASRGRLIAAGLLVALIAVAVGLRRLPAEVGLFYLGMGLVSMVAYWRDKRAAEKDAWRTPEATLHGIDLVGGVVGGLLAQQLLRHKTRKQAFVVVTAGIATLHALALMAWITPLREMVL